MYVSDDYLLSSNKMVYNNYFTIYFNSKDESKSIIGISQYGNPKVIEIVKEFDCDIATLRMLTQAALEMSITILMTTDCIVEAINLEAVKYHTRLGYTTNWNASSYFEIQDITRNVKIVNPDITEYLNIRNTNSVIAASAKEEPKENVIIQLHDSIEYQLEELVWFIIDKLQRVGVKHLPYHPETLV